MSGTNQIFHLIRFLIETAKLLKHFDFPATIGRRWLARTQSDFHIFGGHNSLRGSFLCRAAFWWKLDWNFSDFTQFNSECLKILKRFAAVFWIGRCIFSAIWDENRRIQDGVWLNFWEILQDLTDVKVKVWKFDGCCRFGCRLPRSPQVHYVANWHLAANTVLWKYFLQIKTVLKYDWHDMEELADL